MLSSLGTALGDRLGRNSRAVRALRPAYAACLSAVYGRRGLPWQLNGEPLRIDPAVRHMIPRENAHEAHDRLAAMGLAARAITSAEPLFTQSGHVVLEPK